MENGPELELFGRAKYAATAYFDRKEKPDKRPSVKGLNLDLLRAVQGALRDSRSSNKKLNHELSESVDDSRTEVELSWSSDTVVASKGGIIYQKWTVGFENQGIQYACWGWLEQPGSILEAVSSTGRDAAVLEMMQAMPNLPGKETFSPFAQSLRVHRKQIEPTTRVHGIFIFLRSITRIFLDNGMDYTIHIPFLIRKAWSLHPVGVMVQRFLSDEEKAEISPNDEGPLPTLFSLTDPFVELRVVSVTTKISGGLSLVGDVPSTDSDGGAPTVSLSEDKRNSYVPPSDKIIFCSGSSIPEEQIFISVDDRGSQFTVWRYAHIIPEETLAPPNFEFLSKSRQPSSSTGTNISSFTNDLLQKFGAPGGSWLTPSTTAKTTTLNPLDAETMQSWGSSHERNDSGTRNELSATLDRMALGSQASHQPIGGGSPLDQDTETIRPSYWAQKLHTEKIPSTDSVNVDRIAVSLFDSRFDGPGYQALLAICFPNSQLLAIYRLSNPENELKIALVDTIPAIAACSINATRTVIKDLIYVKPDSTLRLMVGGMNEIPISFTLPELDSEGSQDDRGRDEREAEAELDISMDSVVDKHRILALLDPVYSNLTLVMEGGDRWRASLGLEPRDPLTLQCFQALACVLPEKEYYGLFRCFVDHEQKRRNQMSRVDVSSGDFDSFQEAISDITGITIKTKETVVNANPFTEFLSSSAISKLLKDPAFALLCSKKHPQALNMHSIKQPETSTLSTRPPVSLQSCQLLISCLHTVGEDLKLSVKERHKFAELCPLLVKLFSKFRPEWVSYYTRLCPDSSSAMYIDQEALCPDLPITPFSIFAHLFSRFVSPDKSWPLVTPGTIPNAALHYGYAEPFIRSTRILTIYSCFSDTPRKDLRSRCEKVVEKMVDLCFSSEDLDDLPFGIALPIREVLRICQMNPPSAWPLAAYELLGRKDLAKMAVAEEEDPLPEKDDDERNDSIMELVQSASTKKDAKQTALGSEMKLTQLTKIRFGTDRRLDEVSRMLQSTSPPSVKIDEHVVDEHDIAKEQQSLVLRVAERTSALALGRALYTFASIDTVTNDTYKVPKLEYGVRVMPFNTVVVPESGKLSVESLAWAEFHNGVAAGLRIAPSAHPIPSSWITFNKPSELTPEHAGFLYALGLTGHLRSMLTWHTFTYLTPKHDLTSIGVLLGLSTANIGTANRHVTKLLAVHTPALLPKSSVELNIPILTQAAGMSGVGLLYLGTGSRRMAEVTLGELGSQNASIFGLSSTSRESYAVSTALAFGMIMIGRGATATSPADLNFISRLYTLIHGSKARDPPFDVNITSPCATVALAMMFLRTGKQDIADSLEIPDTITGLNRIPPNFLLYRALGKALIMWDQIEPTHEWIMGRLPPGVASEMERRVKGEWVDSSFELAYYYIVSGSSLAMGLRFAGTANEDAYLSLIHFYDLFTRIAAISGGYDHKIKKAAVREGLNLMSLALAMVMAGTGEINCLRRFRFAHGQVGLGSRYGAHVANEMAIGMLFLGGGHFSVGNSDSAVACLLAACYPRFPSVSSDNRTHLQALRHLWVLAVEPRCLIARDVDTKDIVYLPIKVQVKEGDSTRSSQLISPTLIPDLSRLIAIKVDTPRYWPFILDITRVQRHRERLLQDQTLWVKRRTGFLGYSEDPKGSRSIFVRSGAASGDSALLEYPSESKDHSIVGKDFKEFITSFSIHPTHLAYAQYLCQLDTQDSKTRVFQTYSHAALLECLTLDKSEILTAHIEIYLLRTSHPDTNPLFGLQLENLMFANAFYSSVFDKKFNLRSDHERPPLLRPSFLLASLDAIDKTIASYTSEGSFRHTFSSYCNGNPLTMTPIESRRLAAYLLRESVPLSSVLVQLRVLALKAHAESKFEEGDSRVLMVHQAIRSVLHESASLIYTPPSVNKWSLRSLEEVCTVWGLPPAR